MTCDEYMDALGDDYKTVKLLSKKNGATVIKMRNTRLGRDMILKKYEVPVPAYNSLKHIRHDNLPEIYDSIILSDGQIVLEEYIDGITVAEVLESGRYTYHGAKEVLSGVCSAAMTLHSLGYIHRDIKPENIIITTDGRVKLIDLNAARRLDSEKTKDTVVLGTIGYAAPEQLGISATDERADIYSIGILLNVMLTGEHPGKLLAKGRARSIILKCTATAPEARYSTVEKLMRAL